MGVLTTIKNKAIENGIPPEEIEKIDFVIEDLGNLFKSYDPTVSDIQVLLGLMKDYEAEIDLWVENLYPTLDDQPKI